jgi:hypothetical protein
MQNHPISIVMNPNNSSLKHYTVASYCLRQCLLMLSQHNPGTNTPYVCIYDTFQPTVAIRYKEPLQSPFLPCAVPLYTASDYILGVHCSCNGFVMKCIKY